MNYQNEKDNLQNELQVIQNSLALMKQNEKDVDEYIKRIKHYATAPILTREMCLKLIEFVTIDEYNPDNKTRDIHIYYKLIDNIKGQDFSLSKRESNQLVPMFQTK